MNSPGLKIDQFIGLFKGISRPKLEMLFWVGSCLLAGRTCNLSQCAKDCAHVFPGWTYAQRYGDLITFFCTSLVEELLRGIFLLVVSLLAGMDTVHLVIDRTNWSIGQKEINILAIGAVWRGVFIPLAWCDLERKGNSNHEQRLALLDQVLFMWQDTRLPLPVLQLSGDREFIGLKWIMGLDQRQLRFILRLKENQQFKLWWHKGFRDKKVSVKVLRRYLQRKGQTKAQIVLADEYIAHLVIVPTAGAEWMYLITNLENPDEAPKLYRLRWKIECCFKYLKTLGFNLEDLNLEGEHKVRLLIGVLVLLFALTVQQGMIAIEQKQPRQITYANGTIYPAQSIFALGLNQLSV